MSTLVAFPPLWEKIIIFRIHQGVLAPYPPPPPSFARLYTCNLQIRLYFSCNWPFAWLGNMVQNPLGWVASDAVGQKRWQPFIVFWCPTAPFAIQRSRFCTMWPEVMQRAHFNSILVPLGSTSICHDSFLNLCHHCTSCCFAYFTDLSHVYY